MLIDEVDITLIAGHGGPGKVAFNGLIPTGGSGGRGGDIWIQSTTDLHALNQFSATTTVSAPNGDPGADRGKTGRGGTDVTITLPVGTVITDAESAQTWEILPDTAPFRICKGGIGGRGNLELQTARNRSPHKAQAGLPGQTRQLHLNLRYLADFGLVGLPNAGKSSLLNVLTNATAKVGAYPFTTLEANLGVLAGKIIADIPGLIAGASDGKGLGTKFLKHIEKVKLILHCVAADTTTLLDDYHTIVTELVDYGADLDTKPRLILLTKTDLVDTATRDQCLQELASFGYPVQAVSIYDPASIDALKERLSI